MVGRDLRTLDRRTFLTGCASAALLAACGGSADSPSTDTVAVAGPATLRVAQLFSGDRVVGARAGQRLPFALIGDDGPLVGDRVDAEVRVLDPRGGVLTETVVAARVAAHTHGEDSSDHQHDHPASFRYYAPRVDFVEPGLHRLEIETAEGRGSLDVQVFAPSDLALPSVGSPFPSLVTPTVADAAGVDTLCTRAPQCSFHGRSADAIVGSGDPFALLVATPAYCQTQFCGPVLEVLIEAEPAIPTIHVEVWANPAEVGGNIADPRIRPAPALAALGLTFEPSLFIVGGDGIIRERLDNLFDSDELAEALALAR